MNIEITIKKGGVMIGIGLHLCLRQNMELRQKLALRQELVLAQKLVMKLDGLIEAGGAFFLEYCQLQRYAVILKRKKIDDFLIFLDREARRGPVNFTKNTEKEIAKERNKVHNPKLAQTLASLLRIKNADIKDAKIILDISSSLCGSSENPVNCWQVVLSNLDRVKPSTEQGMVSDFVFEAMYLFIEKIFADDQASIADAFRAIKYYSDKFKGRKIVAFVKHLDSLVFGDTRTPLSVLAAKMTWNSSTIDDNKLLFALTVIAQSNAYSTQVYSYDAGEYLELIFKDEDVYEFIGKIYNLPSAMQVVIFKIFEDETTQAKKVVAKLDSFAAHKSFRRSRDIKRTVFRLLYRFLNMVDGKKALNHFVSLVGNFNELNRGIKAVENILMTMYRDHSGMYYGGYPFHARTLSDMEFETSRLAYSRYSDILSLDEGDIQKLSEDDKHHLVQRSGLLDICYQYALVCRDHQYEIGAKLAGQVVKGALSKNFHSWRYSHEMSENQIGFLSGAKEAWKDELQINFTIGMTDGLRQRLAMIRNYGQRLVDLWREEAKFDAMIDIDSRLEEIRVLMERAGAKNEALIAEQSLLSKSYARVKTIQQIVNVNDANYRLVCNHPFSLYQLRDSLSSAEARDTVEAIINIADLKCFNGVSYITIADSDKPYDTLRVGRIPVMTCMRWHEWTGNNRCLPAYAVDANKRVLYISEGLEVIGRSILRILPMKFGRNDSEIIPVLLLDRIYSTVWSLEIGAQLAKWLIKKAETISSSNGMPVMIAFSDFGLAEIFQKVLPKSKLKKRKLTFDLPKSMNQFEYSDVLGGRLPSGAKTNKNDFYTFFVGSNE